MAAVSSRLSLILKVLAGLFALVIVLIAAAVIVATSSSFQESMLRRQLANAGATDIQLEAVHAGWQGLTAEHIGFTQNGLKLSADGLVVRYQLRRLLDHVVELPEVTGRNIDLTVDAASATKPSAAGGPAKSSASAPASPFPVKLPYRIVLGKLDISGKLTGHLGLIQLETGDWHLTGGGLAPGSTGKLRLEFHPRAPAFTTAAGGTIDVAAELPESADGQIGSAQLKIMADALPLVWANLAATAKGVQINDGQISAQLLAAADAKGVTILPGSGVQIAHLKVQRIDSTVHVNRPQGATFSAALLRPYPVDAVRPLAALEAAGAADWVKITLGNIPLEAAAPWLPGRQLAGTWVQGDGIVRYAPGQVISFSAITPWQFSDVGFAEGGADYFHGSITIKPSMLYGPATQWVRFTDLSVSDTRGYKLEAHGGLVLKGQEDQVNGGITLKATLPFFPGLPEKTGPYGVDLSATAHVLPAGKSTLTRLRAAVTGRQGEMLASIAADQPVSVERTPEDEWLFSCPAPLQVKTAAVPLAGLESFFAARGFQVDGILPATEFALWFTPRHFRLEPKTPIAVQHVHLVRAGEVVVDRAMVRLTPALDLQIEHHLLPTFRFDATSTFSVKSGVVAIDGNRIGLFDFATTVAGTEKLAQMQPKNIQGGLWLDLGAMGKTGLFAHQRLPGKGEFRLQFGKSTTDPKYVEFQGGVDRVFGRDGQAAPALEFLGRAQGNFAQKAGGFGVKTMIHPLATAAVPKPRPTEFHFGFKVDFQKLSILDIASKLESDYVNADDVFAFEHAFTPALALPPSPASPAPVAPTPPVPAAALTGDEPPPWGIVRGHFTLGIKELAYAPYTIKNLGGRLELTDHAVSLQGLSGEILGGKWTADFTSGYQSGHPEAPVALKAHFAMTQIDAAQAVHLRYPDPPAGIDGKLNLEVTVAGEGKTWEELPEVSTGRITLTATGGHMHLLLPKKDMISNALIVGGVFTFSKELRALGRFVKTLEDLPVNRIQATGTLAKDGKLQLQTISMDSPQLKLNAVGEVKNAKTRDLLGEPLQVNASLSASSDIAIMLDGMNLLEKGDSKGFLKMKEPFMITGSVGQPNLQPLYDLLARAVDNSHGSWGLLMRKVQGMVPKSPPPPGS